MRIRGIGCVSSCQTRLRFVASKDGCIWKKWMKMQWMVIIQIWWAKCLDLCANLKCKRCNKSHLTSWSATSGLRRRTSSSDKRFMSLVPKTGLSLQSFFQGDLGASAGSDGTMCSTPASWGESGLEKKTNSWSRCTAKSAQSGPKYPKWNLCLAALSARLRIDTIRTSKAKTSWK